MSAAAGVLLVLEDAPGRLERIRAAAPPHLTVRAFDRVAGLVAWLEASCGPPALITLDYHLASRAHGTGLDAALFLAGLPAPLCPVLVHTSDTAAAGDVVELLRGRGWRVEASPFEGGGWASAARRLLS